MITPPKIAPFVFVVAVSAAAANALTGVPDPVADDAFAAIDLDEARLGQALFYDPILSGNRNIACATCHHPRFGTSDGVSLDLGEGGVGLGPARVPDPANMPEQRIPRNAPALFNLGARDFTVLFHDGRIETDPNRASGLRTPLEEDMMMGFSGVLSAQTMFPVLSPDEMAGHYQENDVSKAVRQGRLTGPGGAWDIITHRVASIPAYQSQFNTVYPEIAAGRPVAFTDISNAIAAFIAFEWRSDSAPFDQWLAGKIDLPPQAQTGAALFYGDAGCASCHSGPFLTDQGFHAMGAPQLGPGKAERFESHQRDVGRMRVTGNDTDAYAFRTPSLRNVTHTAPYGHAGGHVTLGAFLADHAAPAAALAQYQPQAVLPAFDPAKPDWAIQNDPAEQAAIMAAVSSPMKKLTAEDIAALVAFLGTLDDPVALAGRLGVPQSVPSGLPVDR